MINVPPPINPPLDTKIPLVDLHKCIYVCMLFYIIRFINENVYIIIFQNKSKLIQFSDRFIKCNLLLIKYEFVFN